MIIKDLTKEYLNDIQQLMYEKYNEEKEYVNELPDDIEFPNLDYFVNNELGVVAIDGNGVVGFIGVYKPWKGAFDTYDALGTFSPFFANATVKQNRKRIYQDMIEYGYDKWDKLNIVTMGICLSAHDIEAKNALFEYGFGMRNKDLIKVMTYQNINSSYIFKELSINEFPSVRNLRLKLCDHLKKSPCFQQSTKEEDDSWIKTVEKGDRRTFVLIDNNIVIAYIDITEESDNFVSWHNKMANISGAYCLEEYRGSGCYDILLQEVTNKLINEGYIYLGVDHESYNPTASRYWQKHFKEYTNSVVKRIENWSKNK